MICSDVVAENLNDRKFQGTEFYFKNLAADICLPKMVAELLSHPKRQFHPTENNRHSFFLYYEIPGDILLSKMPAELPPPNRYLPKLAVRCP